MPTHLSLDLRKRAVAAYENGEGSQRAIASRFNISPNTLNLWLKRKRETGSLEPKPASGGAIHKKIMPEHDTMIIEWLRANPTASLGQLAQMLDDEHELTIDRSQLSRVVKRLGWTRKKTASQTHEWSEQMFR